MNIIKQITTDRIGPELYLTHWMLYFKVLGRILAKNKLKEFKKNSSIRPYASLVGGNAIKIGKNVVIRTGCQLHANPKKNCEILIEDNVLIAPDVFITTNNHNYLNKDKPIIFQGGNAKSIHIKEGAWIARGATILSGVTIGKNSVIAAGAVVVNDVKDFTVVGGVPAKLIKTI